MSGYSSPKFVLCIVFDKKWVGRFFYKLIWSPWLTECHTHISIKRLGAYVWVWWDGLRNAEKILFDKTEVISLHRDKLYAGLPDFSCGTIYQKQGKCTKWPQQIRNIPKDRKIEPMSIKYVCQHQPLQDPPKFTQSGIFGMKIYHLATLVVCSNGDSHFYLLPVTYAVIKARVTRLGEFSPNGWLLTLGSFIKIEEVDHILWIHFFTVGGFAIMLTRW
jgi:hypothetical protein